nr:permease-like cell division protein FtsX [Lachnoclostridium phocaeense]
MERHKTLFWIVFIISICVIIGCGIFIYNIIDSKREEQRQTEIEKQYEQENIQSEIKIEIYFNENVTNDQIQQVISALDKNDQIKEITQHSSEEYKEKYFGDDTGLADGFEDEVEFGPYLELIVSEDIDFDSIEEKIKEFDFVNDIEKY